MSGTDGGPWDFDQARAAARRASAAQRAAETAMRDAARDAAEKEREYRVALARTIVGLHADGTAWSACGDLARGDDHVAGLRVLRDVAVGVREAVGQAAWRCAADRRDVERFAAWSMRADFSGGVEPGWSSVIGGRCGSGE